MYFSDREEERKRDRERGREGGGKKKTDKKKKRGLGMFRGGGGVRGVRRAWVLRNLVGPHTHDAL